jgi:TPR repeat protein
MRKVFIVLLNWLSRSPLGGRFFKTLLAAAAVGDGSRAIKSKDYENAYHILRRFEKDQIDDVWVASCQYMLGTLYLDGQGISKNEEKAISVFQLAASAGNDEAIRFMRRWNAKQRNAL